MSDTKLGSEDLAKLVAAERLEREQACGAEVEHVLAKHGCRLEGVPSMIPDGAGGWKTVVQVAVRAR